MVESYLLSRPWISVVTWLVLYSGDYYLTIWGASLYQAQNSSRIEGSYELTPEYQSEIDNLRLVSPKFLVWLIGIAAVLLAAGRLLRALPWAYGLLVGYLVLVELAIYPRHVRNIITFRRLLRQPRIDDGQADQPAPRNLVYRYSSRKHIRAAFSFFLACAVFHTWILLGGMVGMLHCALGDWLLARKHERRSRASVDGASLAAAVSTEQEEA